MSNRKTIRDYIDRYHAGEVSEEDFTRRVKSSPLLQEEYEGYKADLELIRASTHQQLKNKASDFLEEHEQMQRRVFIRKRTLAIAAGFALIAIVWFLLQYSSQPVEAADLFATHFELPLPVNERNGTTTSGIWNEAMKAYAGQDYNRAAGLLSSAIAQPEFPLKERGKLYLGVSYLMSGDPEKAVDILSRVNRESSYAQLAEWYTALTYLKMDEEVQAETVLQQIADQSDHMKREEAEKILAELD